jgi:hypothetical protein
VFDAPVSVNVITPVRVPLVGNPDADTMLMDRFAEPVPEAGLTRSHDWFDTAVHVTVPVPVCVSRTTCAAVCDTNAAPFVDGVVFLGPMQVGRVPPLF